MCVRSLLRHPGNNESQFLELLAAQGFALEQQPLQDDGALDGYSNMDGEAEDCADCYQLVRACKLP